MATFQQKTWVDRVSEYPTRRILTDVYTEQTQTVTVARSEGQVSSEGDAFNAQNMNDLELRINTVVQDLNEDFQAGVDAVYNALVAIGITPSGSTPEDIARTIQTVGSGNATAGQIIEGATAYASNSLLTGTMRYRGAWTGSSAGVGSGNVTIPQGYHNGSGYVNCSGSYTSGQAAQQTTDHGKVVSQTPSIRAALQNILNRSASRTNTTWRASDNEYIQSQVGTAYDLTTWLEDNV